MAPKTIAGIWLLISCSGNHQEQQETITALPLSSHISSWRNIHLQNSIVKNQIYPKHKHAKILPAKLSKIPQYKPMSPWYLLSSLPTNNTRISCLVPPCLFSTLRIYIKLTTINLEWKKHNIQLQLVFQLQAIQPLPSNLPQLCICLSHVFLICKPVSHSALAWLHLQVWLVPLLQFFIHTQEPLIKYS